MVDSNRPVPFSALPAPSSSEVYPSSLQSAPYYTAISFVKYNRDVTSTQATYTPQQTINLPLPNELAENYGIINGERKLGLFGGSFNEYKQVGENIVATAQNVIGGALNVGSDLIRGLGGDFNNNSVLNSTNLERAAIITQSLSPSFLQDSSIGAAFTRYVGMVPNPHLTMIFDGVSLRTHNLSWTFSPRSLDETKTLRRILLSLRKMAHPDFNATVGRFGLDFPSQCFINFKGLADVYPIKRSVIQSVSIDHAPSSEPAFYAGGAPVVTTLRLSLTETEILTAKDFEQTANANEPWDASGNYATGPDITLGSIVGSVPNPTNPISPSAPVSSTPTANEF